MLNESYADYTECESADLTSTFVVLIHASGVRSVLVCMPILRHAHFYEAFLA